MASAYVTNTTYHIECITAEEPKVVIEEPPRITVQINERRKVVRPVYRHDWQYGHILTMVRPIE